MSHYFSCVLTFLYQIIDPAARVAIAAALRAIAVRASNQFGDGGSNDVWIRRVLPIAFIGRKDKDAGALFEEVWNEGGQVANLNDNGSSFAMQLQEKTLPFLTLNLVEALNDVSWDRRRMACVSLDELCKSNILAPAPRSINQDSYAQKDWIERDLVRSESSKIILITCVKLIVNTRMWTGKSNLLETTVAIAGNWVSTPFYEELQPIFSNRFVWDDLFEGDSWFEGNHNDDSHGTDSSINTSVVLNEKDNEEPRIDFSEGDEILCKEEDNVIVNDEDTDALTSKQYLTYSGLCRVLLKQGIKSDAKGNGEFYSNDALSYRAVSLQALGQFLKCLENSEHLEKLFRNVAPKLLSVIQNQQSEEKIPPLIVAKATHCLGYLIWEGIDFDETNVSTQVDLMIELFTKNCGENQRAWTIREASAFAMSNICKKAKYTVLRKLNVLDNILICSKLCPNDKKFWKVRLAKLMILKTLCSRADAKNKLGSDENQLMLEALLPIKESIISVAKNSLLDSEARVTAIASDILASLSWWP